METSASLILEWLKWFEMDKLPKPFVGPPNIWLLKFLKEVGMTKVLIGGLWEYLPMR